MPNIHAFLPIVIPAGTIKGIYILVNETSTDANLIAFDRKSGSTCAADHLQPYDFQTWFEDDDMVVSEGVFTNDWQQSVGPRTSHPSISLPLIYHDLIVFRGS